MIAADEVGGWLSDSVVGTVTYHHTTREFAEDIVQHGVDLERSERSAFGQGFYTSSVPEEFRGPAIVRVAIKTRNPLIGNLDEVEAFIDRLLEVLRPRARGITQEIAAAIRLELLDLGYDGIVIRDAGGDGVDYIVAIASGTTRVVVDE